MSPTFPRYNSKEHLSTQLDTRPQEVMREGAGDQFAIINKAAGDVSEIVMKWSVAQNSMQETAIKSNLESLLLETQTAAEQDTDINGAEGRIKQLKSSKDEWLKKIPDSAFKQKLGLELSREIDIASLKIKNIYAKKKVFADNVNTVNLLNGYAKQGTPEAYQKAFDLIQDKVATGFYTPEQGEGLFYKTRKWGVQNDVFSDSATEESDSKVLTELNKGDKGVYSFLSADERENMITETRRHINQNRLNQDESRINKRLTILNDFANGKIDPAVSSDFINQLSIDDPELGEAIKKGSDTLFTPKLDNEAFAEATKEVFRASTREEISKYLTNVLRQNANKDIGRERLAILINAATERAKSLQATKDSQPVTISQKQAETDSLVKSMLYTTNSLLSVPNLIVNFFSNLSSGSSPKQAHEAAIVSEINRTNPLSVKYKVGDIVTNPSGISGEVIGFNENGSPIIRRKK